MFGVLLGNFDSLDFFHSNDNYPAEFLDEDFWIDLIP